MKGHALKLRKSHVLGMALLAVGVISMLALTTSLWGAATGDECFFEDGTHRGWIDGLGTFTLDSEESVSANVGASFVNREGRTITPIRIRGMAGRGRATGIGETVYWLDTSRPVASGIRAKLPGQEFPAVHQMGFHLFLTTEALPGKIFRSINPAIMVNDNATSFPPKVGSRYALRNVVDFEEIHEPGVVAARILSNHNRYVGSKPSGLGQHFED